MRSRAKLTAMPILALMLASSCGGGGHDAGGTTTTVATTAASRPSSTAELSIESPRNGQVVGGSTVHLVISLKDAKIVPASTTNLQPDEGHVHVILDDQLISMTFGLKQTIPDVLPGQHLLRVEFVASDHAPFDPRVFVQVSFEVRG